MTYPEKWTPGMAPGTIYGRRGQWVQDEVHASLGRPNWDRRDCKPCEGLGYTSHTLYGVADRATGRYAEEHTDCPHCDGTGVTGQETVQ